MSTEFWYFCLMVTGWVFLGGWALALVTACAMAFRKDSLGPGALIRPMHGRRS
jgi:hypothetical protein